jgi:lysophospholipase L1-like esterase
MKTQCIVLALLALLGCQSAPDTTVEDVGAHDAVTGAEPGTEPVRYLALGDSYTIGESVPTSDRWPVQLVEALQGEGVRFTDDAPQIIARTGWTTRDLSRAMDSAAPEGPYHMVSLLIGVNNQFRGRSTTEYRAELIQLLERSIHLTGGDPRHVLVLSIPDWGATPYGQRADPEAVARQIDIFNEIKRQESARLGVHYVDITPISRRARTHPELVAHDGLHPSGVMYAAFVAEALSISREILVRP